MYKTMTGESVAGVLFFLMNVAGVLFGKGVRLFVVYGVFPISIRVTRRVEIKGTCGHTHTCI